MKKSWIIGILAAVIILAGIPVILQYTGETEGTTEMNKPAAIPAIDSNRPAVTETATFAMG